MRLPRPRKPRELTEHDRTLLDRARQLEDAGTDVDVDRARFVRALVEAEECTLLDELGVRRWLRHHPAEALDHEDPQLREYHRSMDEWHREKIRSRGRYPIPDHPRAPGQRLLTFPWPDVPGSAGEG